MNKLERVQSIIADNSFSYAGDSLDILEVVNAIKDGYRLYKESDNYIDRFKEEYSYIAMKSKRLGEIIRKAETNQINFTLDSTLEQLNKQLNIMCAYLAILEERAKTEGINLD